METIYFDRLGELKRTKDELEKRLKVSISIQGKRVTINGGAFEEFEALTILEAMNFGFSAKIALMLKDADCQVIVKGNEVGLICPAEEIDYVLTGMTNLIRGSKQANIYKFLERINAARKNKNKE